MRDLHPIRDYGLVLAIDNSRKDEVVNLVTKVGPLVDGIKLGVPTLLANGVSIVGRVRDFYDGPLIADLKVADIGIKSRGETYEWSGTNRSIVETAVSAGIEYVICHTIVGTSSIEECIAAAHSLGGRVLTLPYMTHEGAGLLFDHPLDSAHVSKTLEGQGMGRVGGRILELAREKKAAPTGTWRSRQVTVSDLILLLGEELGVDGYIGPANHLGVLRDYRRLTERFVMATGVGRQGGSVREVFLELGEKSAAIVGHAITAAPDPINACEGLAAERDAARKEARKGM